MSSSKKGGGNSGRRKPAKDLPKGMTIADYETGKGKPPPSPWEKGGPSPNPKGRPLKPKVGKRDLDHFLNEKVVVPSERGPIPFTKRELGYLAIANHFGKGVPWAVKLVVQYQGAREDGDDRDPWLFDPRATAEVMRAVEKQILATKRDEGDKP